MPDPVGAGAGAGVTPPAGNQLTIRDYIKQQAEKLKIPGDLALAIVDTESGGQHSAATGPTTSKVGARGFFQLMPQTAQELGVDPNDPFQNIDGGLRYFRQQLDAHNQDVRLALAAYNAGPNHPSLAAGQVPDIPETRDYVMKVLQTWQAGGVGAPSAAPRAGASATAAKPALSTPPPAFATAGMQPASPALASKQVVPPRNLLESAIAPVVGFGKGVGQTLSDVGSLAERVTGKQLPDLQGDMAAHGAGEQIGKFAEQAGEYALPAGEVTKIAKATNTAARLVKLGMRPGVARIAAAAVEGGLQAGPAAAIAEVHGDDPESTAVISAAMPVAGKLVSEMAPAIRRAAITRMARFMERGVKGDVTPELQKGLAQAASDFIDLPLQRTWRQTAALTRGVRKSAGESLQAALAGPLGDVPVPKAPVYQALDGLVDEVQHLSPVKGGVRTITFRPEIVDAVTDLKSLLNEYPADIPARQLHDLKQVWWKSIYPIRESGQPVGATRELLTSAQKEARMRGAAAISKVLETNAPDVAQLDNAVSHAIKLDQFTKRLALKARTGTLAKPGAKYSIGAAGGAVGIAAGSAVGHPFIGAHIGYATSRMLLSAIESPRWRLLPIATRRTLANAIAAGQPDQVRKIVTPIVLAATADQDNLLSDSNSASVSR